MNAVWPVSALAQGVVAGVVALIVLAVRAAIDGRPGPTFADLWTAVAVGVAVGLVALLTPRLAEWQIRRALRGFRGESSLPAPRTPADDETAPAQHGGMDRFDKFTDNARKVLTLSQDEAQRFNHHYIGTEHLLLGLVRVEEGVAARVLAMMNVDLAKVRTAVEFIIGRGDIPVVGEVGLTPRAKRVIELAIDEARTLEHRYIGTEHLLLGLIREGEGIAAGVLQSLGVEFDRTRHEVLRTIAASAPDENGG